MTEQRRIARAAQERAHYALALQYAVRHILLQHEGQVSGAAAAEALSRVSAWEKPVMHQCIACKHPLALFVCDHGGCGVFCGFCCKPTDPTDPAVHRVIGDQDVERLQQLLIESPQLADGHSVGIGSESVHLGLRVWEHQVADDSH